MWPLVTTHPPRNVIMGQPKFEQLVANVSKAKEGLRKEEEKLTAALDTVALGHVVTIDSLAHQVVEEGGARKMKCMFTKRQIAAIRGEEIPPLVIKKRRTKAEVARDAAKEAERTAAAAVAAE